MHILHFQISDHLKIRTLVPQGKSHVCEKPVLCLHFPSSVISMLSDWLHRGQKLRHTRAKLRNVSVGKLRSLFSLCPTVICATTCLVIPPTQKSIRLVTSRKDSWSLGVKQGCNFTGKKIATGEFYSYLFFYYYFMLSPLSTILGHSLCKNPTNIASSESQMLVLNKI